MSHTSRKGAGREPQRGSVGFLESDQERDSVQVQRFIQAREANGASPHFHDQNILMLLFQAALQAGSNWYKHEECQLQCSLHQKKKVSICRSWWEGWMTLTQTQLNRENMLTK